MINKQNLMKLAHFLWCNIENEEFDMSTYRTDDSKKRELDFKSINDCGTVGCALGWSPFVGGLEVDISDYDYRENEGILVWKWYCERVFGESYQNNPRLDFIFSGHWWRVDNTVEGAVKRIILICEDLVSEREIGAKFKAQFVDTYNEKINPEKYFGKRLNKVEK